MVEGFGPRIFDQCSQTCDTSGTDSDMKLPKNRSVQKSTLNHLAKPIFLGSMLIFSLRYPRNKLQITFLSALVCPNTRLQPPTPQPAINSQSLLHYVAWWCEGPRPDKSTPKNISTRYDKMVFPKKITSQRRASSVTKNVGILQKKRRHFTISPDQTNSRKTQGYLQISFFFWQSWSRTIPSHFGGCLMIWPLITLHTLV